jgi:hypothetical protein
MFVQTGMMVVLVVQISPSQSRGQVARFGSRDDVVAGRSAISHVPASGSILAAKARECGPDIEDRTHKKSRLRCFGAGYRNFAMLPLCS